VRPISPFKRIAAILAFCLPSWLTRPLYRLIGHRVGRNTKLPLFSFVCAQQIDLGNDVDIRPFVFISVSSLTIGSNTIVSFGAQIKGDKGFYAGDNCFIGPQCIIHCDEDVRFGFYAGIGPRCMIYTHGSFLPVTLGYPAVFAEVVLEDFVWTAMGVSFLPGAHVERNCLINPGVIVSGRIKTGTRLQMDSDSMKQIELGRLLTFSRRPPAHYHQAIIRGFLAASELKWDESDEGTVFRWNGSSEFRSIPSSNTIEFRERGERIASYDLEGFQVSDSSHHTHRRFLTYVRRRFGLTLRTIYG